MTGSTRKVVAMRQDCVARQVDPDAQRLQGPRASPARWAPGWPLSGADTRSTIRCTPQCALQRIQRPGHRPILLAIRCAPKFLQNRIAFLRAVLDWWATTRLPLHRCQTDLVETSHPHRPSRQAPTAPAHVARNPSMVEADPSSFSPQLPSWGSSSRLPRTFAESCNDWVCAKLLI